MRKIAALLAAPLLLATCAQPTPQVVYLTSPPVVIVVTATPEPIAATRPPTAIPASNTPAPTRTPSNTPTVTITPMPTPTTDCTPVAVRRFQTTILATWKRWWDAEMLAGNTPQEMLKPRIATLSAVLKEATMVHAPTCATKALDLLTGYMLAEIDGYNFFFETGGLSDEFDGRAADLRKQYEAEMEYLASLFPQTLTPRDMTATQVAGEIAYLTEERADGFYLVGVDIAPGVWRSTGGGDSCYWATTSKTGEIIKNHFGMAGGTAYISPSAYQVEFSNCGIWLFLTPP